MRVSRLAGSVEAMRRKLEALTAVARDAGVSEHERANAEALIARLRRQLGKAGAPAGDWTDTLYRLGRRVQQIRESASPAAPKGDWTDNAFRLGKALRRGLKKWSSD